MKNIKPSFFYMIATVLASSAISVNGADAVLTDRGLPFNIEADKVQYSDVTQSAKFTGRVILQQGTMRIEAQTIETLVDPEGYQYATAKDGKNGFVRFEQKREGSNETIKTQSEQLLYDGKNNVILLSKRARAQRFDGTGKLIDQIDADELTYNQLTEVFETNTKGQGRTHILISPKSDTDTQGRK